MPLNVIKVSAFSFFIIVILSDTSELSGVLTSVLHVFFSNYKTELFGDLSSMSGKESILKDSNEDIFLTCVFRSFILCLQQCDLKSAESRLSFDLTLAHRRRFRNAKFRFGLVKKKIRILPYLKIFALNMRFGRSRIDQ